MKLIPTPYRIAAGVTALVVAVVVAIYLVNRNSAPDFKQADLPTQATTGVSLTPQQAQTVRTLVVRLHADLNGIQWTNFNRDAEAWRQFMSLSADMFTAVYNDFGNLYFSEGEGTLYAWVDSEWSWSDTQGIASQEQVLERMASLNLY